MGAIFDQSSRIPELGELIRLARAYVEGRVHFSHVCCAAGELWDAARNYSANQRIKNLASEWVEMSIRVWPEWRAISNQISEEEFRLWVVSQLSVFEPADLGTDPRGPN